VPNLVYLPKPTLPDKFQFLKLRLVPAPRILLFDADGLLVLLNFHGGSIGLFDHIVQVEYLIEYLSIDLLFEFNVLRIYVLLVQVELLVVLFVLMNLTLIAILQF
jgi:hypothetical protein